MFNWNIVAQLTSITLVILSGPVVVLLLFLKKGNL